MAKLVSPGAIDIIKILHLQQGKLYYQEINILNSDENILFQPFNPNQRFLKN